MTASDFYEIFNHFLTSQDPEQILTKISHLEIFGSATLHTDRVYIGRDAPEQFRAMVQTINQKRHNYALSLNHAIIEYNHGIFFLDFKLPRSTSRSVLKITLKNNELVSFLETKTRYNID